jgi:hypothetical protein
MKKKIHRGKILSEVVYASGYQITKLRIALNVSRSTIYNDFEREFIPNDEILKYGKVLGHDFSNEIPELAEFTSIRESKEDYLSHKNYKEKYFELLEKHISLLHELNLLKVQKEPISYKKTATKKRPK